LTVPVDSRKIKLVSCYNFFITDGVIGSYTDFFAFLRYILSSIGINLEISS